MSDLLIRNARILTLAGEGPARGSSLGDLGVIPAGDVLVRDGRIAQIADTPGAITTDGRTIEADGRVLMPAFCDCHTHACWAGSRLDEWDLRLQGASYLEILQAGGGIMATVRAVREASQEELRDSLLRRLSWMLREGTTCVEIKSGYGLSTRDELKMLRAIHEAREAWRGHVVPTACIGHAIDTSVEDFVDRTIHETLDAVHAEFPGIAIDAYCEQGAWSLADCMRLFERAMELGHPIRVHADQFHSLGMVAWSVQHGALSCDHLEASDRPTLELLAESTTYGVMLPCSGFHVDDRYADGRTLADLGSVCAIATNCNPGSAPCSNMPITIALAVRRLGLRPHEAICCATRNACDLLRRQDSSVPVRGRIEPGVRADLLLLRFCDERDLAHEFGGNPVDLVVCAGEVVCGAC